VPMSLPINTRMAYGLNGGINNGRRYGNCSSPHCGIDAPVLRTSNTGMHSPMVSEMRDNKAGKNRIFEQQKKEVEQ
jgi:hypothetical protein